jgi:hypothetical protein
VPISNSYRYALLCILKWTNIYFNNERRLTCVRTCRILYSAKAHLLSDTDAIVRTGEHQAGSTDVVEALNLTTHPGKILQTTTRNYINQINVPFIFFTRKGPKDEIFL